jgi:hypothetical protein
LENAVLSGREQTFHNLRVLVVLLSGFVFGCESLEEAFDDSQEEFDAAAQQAAAEQAAAQQAAATQQQSSNDSPQQEAAPTQVVNGSSVPDGFAGVQWLHTNVSGWPQTATLSSVNINGGSITLNYNKANSWPGVNTAGSSVNANPWIFVNQGGTWYAGTWEWLKVGQTTKSTGAVNGNHIKKAPLNGFRPRSGEVYGFMVSGLARTSVRNVQERSNVVMVRWP